MLYLVIALGIIPGFIGVGSILFTFIVWLAFGRKRSFWAMLKDL